jgi:hypothetical protein
MKDYDPPLVVSRMFRDGCEFRGEAIPSAPATDPVKLTPLATDDSAFVSANGCEGCNEPIYLSRYGYSHCDTTLNVACDARPKPSHPSVPKLEKAEPMEMAKSGAVIRKMDDDLFFVDWGNVHFSTSLKGMRDLTNSLDRFIWQELYPGKEGK